MEKIPLFHIWKTMEGSGATGDTAWAVETTRFDWSLNLDSICNL